MLDEQKIYSELTEIFRDILGDSTPELTAESNSETVPHWDSINHINIVSAAEVAFSVKFRSSEIDAMETVGDMVQIIQSRTR